MLNEREFYGKNYDYVKNERKVLDKMFRKDFMKKYPYADMSKFYFEHDINKDGSWEKTTTYFKNNDMMSTDINSDTFKNDPEMTKYLTINKPKPHFPKIWKLGGEIQELPRGKRDVGFYGKSYYWDEFPTEYVLNYPINQFRIYVNDTDYFPSNLPPLYINTYQNALWDIRKNYFQTIIGVWIATYACGISIQHLTFSQDVPKQITSFMRFHLYFTVRRIMRQLSIGDDSTYNKFNAGFLKDHIPKWTYQEIRNYKNEHLGQDVIPMETGWRGYKHGPGQLRDVQNDYKKFIPKISTGLIKKETELLNHSIEAYIYSILGAQARTRQSIVSGRASALETQKVFRKIVEDSIVNYDTTTWINNMNQAVSDTNVVLNTAISPTLLLIPSSLIILKNPIEGYNNKFKVSTKDMVFGINDGLNYQGVEKNSPVKKQHQLSIKKLETLEEEKIKSPVNKLEKDKIKSPVKKDNTENLIILSLSLIGGVLVSKYIF